MRLEALGPVRTEPDAIPSTVGVHAAVPNAGTLYPAYSIPCAPPFIRQVAQEALL